MVAVDKYVIISYNVRPELCCLRQLLELLYDNSKLRFLTDIVAVVMTGLNFMTDFTCHHWLCGCSCASHSSVVSNGSGMSVFWFMPGRLWFVKFLRCLYLLWLFDFSCFSELILKLIKYSIWSFYRDSSDRMHIMKLCNFSDVNLLLQCFVCLQCFDAVSWTSGRASGL